VQNAGYNRTGVTDPNEEDEISDKQPPHHIVAHTGNNVSVYNLQIEGVSANNNPNEKEDSPAPGFFAEGLNDRSLFLEYFLLIMIKFHKDVPLMMNPKIEMINLP
jgi:hypothetical protein